MTVTDKIDNPQHFVSDPADIWMRIWINLEVQIRIRDHFWLRLEALVQVCTI